MKEHFTEQLSVSTELTEEDLIKMSCRLDEEGVEGQPGDKLLYVMLVNPNKSQKVIKVWSSHLNEFIERHSYIRQSGAIPVVKAVEIEEKV